MQKINSTLNATRPLFKSFKNRAINTVWAVPQQASLRRCKERFILCTRLSVLRLPAIFPAQCLLTPTGMVFRIDTDRQQLADRLQMKPSCLAWRINFNRWRSLSVTGETHLQYALHAPSSAVFRKTNRVGCYFRHFCQLTNAIHNTPLVIVDFIQQLVSIIAA